MTTDDRINELFNRLDKWRCLPNYQLERRADIFFSLYLQAFLENELDIRLQTELIPEFPLHLRTLNWGCKNNQSVKVDYVAVSANAERVIFVELKTDASSIRDGQTDYLKRASETPMSKLVDGVLKICDATKSKSKPKYEKLKQLLREVRLLSESDLVLNLPCKPEIVVLQPCRHVGAIAEFTTYDFAHYDQFLTERFGDPLTASFCRSLRSWHADCRCGRH